MVFELSDEACIVVCYKNVINIDYTSNCVNTNVSELKIRVGERLYEVPSQKRSVETSILSLGTLTKAIYKDLCSLQTIWHSHGLTKP